MAAAVLVAGIAAFVARDGRADRDDFVGSARCGKCHGAELEAWRRGPHSRAGASLGAVAASSCLGCHSTGDAPVGPVAERSVGCEACHGPGKGYSEGDIMANRVLARAMGLRALTSIEERRALCQSCHRQRTRLRTLDLDAEWKRMGHGGQR